MSTVTDPVVAARLLADAAPYDEFVLAHTRGELRLMARDFPRPGRRCTDLTHGTEWFDVTAERLEDLGFLSLTPA